MMEPGERAFLLTERRNLKRAGVIVFVASAWLVCSALRTIASSIEESDVGVFGLSILNLGIAAFLFTRHVRIKGLIKDIDDILRKAEKS